MEMTNLLHMTLTKVDAVQRLVYAVAADEGVDRSGERFDYETSKPEIQAWSEGIHKTSGGLSFGNIRAMHGKTSAGKIVEPIGFNDELKRVEVCLKVVDDAEWTKVTEGVYTGLSFGGSYKKRWADPLVKGVTRYTAAPTELSLADLPCIPGATFKMVKAAGGAEEDVAFKVAKRDDVSAKSVTSKYGAVQFADPTNKKYPLDTAAHVRNAASRWGDAANRAKYSAKDQAAIGARIKAAEKKLGIGDASEKTVTTLLANAMEKLDQVLARPAFQKAAGADRSATLTEQRGALGDYFVQAMAAKTAGTKLAKGLYTVSQLAQLLADLDILVRSTEYEADAEGDGSEVPAMLADVRSDLSAAMVAMTVEETQELEPPKEETMTAAEKLTQALALMKEATTELGKAAGATDLAAVQAIHDAAVLAGAKLPEGAVDAAASEKVAGLTKVVTDLTERLAKVEGESATGQVRPGSNVEALALQKAVESAPFEPVGMGVGGGKEAEKAAGVMALIKVAQANAAPMVNGAFALPEKSRSNLAKLA